MILSKEIEEEIDKTWSDHNKRWHDDFEKILANIKGGKIMFKTYTPPISEGDPCPINVEFISGSTFFDKSNGYIYQILDNGEVAAAKALELQKCWSPHILFDLTKHVSIDKLLNTYIDKELYELIKDYDILLFNYAQSDFYTVYKDQISLLREKINEKIGLPKSIHNFISIHINDVVCNYPNHFGYIYYDNSIKIKAKYMAPF